MKTDALPDRGLYVPGIPSPPRNDPDWAKCIRTDVDLTLFRFDRALSMLADGSVECAANELEYLTDRCDAIARVCQRIADSIRNDPEAWKE